MAETRAPRKMKRLLFVTCSVPESIATGTQSRFFSLLQALSGCFDITVASAMPVGAAWRRSQAYRDGVPAPVVISPGLSSRERTLRSRAKNWLANQIHNYFGSMSYDDSLCQDALLKLLSARSADLPGYDVIFGYYLYYPRLMGYLAENKGVALLVLDNPDVQHERLAQLFPRRSRWLGVSRRFFLTRFRRSEIEACRQADILITASEYDRDVFRRHLPNREILLCPTGVDTEKFTPYRRRSRPGQVTFFGALNGEANVEAAIFFAREIFPKVLERVPYAVYSIVGSNPSKRLLELQSDRIRVTGYVEELPSELSQAGCVVCPLRAAYGVRGRIYEAMALGLPCVVTSAAVRGMGLEGVPGVMIRDDPDQFARAVSDTLLDDGLLSGLSRAVRRWVEENGGFSATYERLAADLSRRVSCS